MKENDDIKTIDNLQIQNEIDNYDLVNFDLSSSIQLSKNSVFKMSFYKKSSKIIYEKEKILKGVIDEFINRNNFEINKTFSMPHLNHINLKNKKRKDIFPLYLNKKKKKSKNNQLEQNNKFLDEDDIEDENEDEEEEERNHNNIIKRSQSMEKKKEMTKFYYDENDKINQNIK